MCRRCCVVAAACMAAGEAAPGDAATSRLAPPCPPPPPPSAAGTLQRDFKHLAVDMFLTEEEGQKVLKVDCHFGKRKALASIRTCTSHVQVGCWPCAGPRRLPAAGIASLEGPLWAAHLPSTCQKA